MPAHPLEHELPARGAVAVLEEPVRALLVPDEAVAHDLHPVGLGEGDEGVVVVNQTPFYGESGGQVGDTGVIESENGARFRVSDTQRKADGLFVHVGKVEVGGFVPGQAVRLRIDTTIRNAAL